MPRARPGVVRALGLACAATALVVATGRYVAVAPKPQPASGFAATVASLSEPGGYFDTDNLISNERSYLQVIPDLRRLKVRGGAYIGVGPDQNFSYISEVRPSVAFIIDVRRDNLLLHLLFKALFEISPTRIEYLAQLLGRPLPPAVNGWRDAPLERLLGYFDRAAPDTESAAGRRRRVEDIIRQTGVALSPEDLTIIAGFHRRFIDDGLALRFNSTGRPPQWYYPTYRELLLETDSAGNRTNYLASEETYQFVKGLHARHQIIPVVGDISGPTAVQAIGKAIADRGDKLSAFYTSNVEFYLFGQGTFARFVTNMRSLPRASHSVVIRSVFGRYTGFGRPGDGSTSQLQQVDDLVTGYDDGRYRSYGELVGRNR